MPPESENNEKPQKSKQLTRTPPIAVYIGAKASSEAEETLEFIWALKNIPCYKAVYSA